MNYKIYKIVDNSNGNVYIGQTCEDIRIRISKHKHDFNKTNKNVSSEQILANGDWSYEIVQDLLTKQVADDLEKYYIKNTPNCINKVKYDFNQNEYNREYREKNTEKIKKNDRQYQIKKYQYQKTWGGNKLHNNNLLLIDVEGLFN
tara:strand:+ start:565 stop:1002 length:438 start_codon:yes stop_codon:yes gene_type:complete